MQGHAMTCLGHARACLGHARCPIPLKVALKPTLGINCKQLESSFLFWSFLPANDVLWKHGLSKLQVHETVAPFATPGFHGQFSWSCIGFTTSEHCLVSAFGLAQKSRETAILCVVLKVVCPNPKLYLQSFCSCRPKLQSSFSAVAILAGRGLSVLVASKWRKCLH